MQRFFLFVFVMAVLLAKAYPALTLQTSDEDIEKEPVKIIAESPAEDSANTDPEIFGIQAIIMGEASKSEAPDTSSKPEVMYVLKSSNDLTSILEHEFVVAEGPLLNLEAISDKGPLPLFPKSMGSPSSPLAAGSIISVSSPSGNNEWFQGLAPDTPEMSENEDDETDDDVDIIEVNVHSRQ